MPRLLAVFHAEEPRLRIAPIAFSAKFLAQASGFHRCTDTGGDDWCRRWIGAPWSRAASGSSSLPGSLSGPQPPQRPPQPQSRCRYTAGSVRVCRGKGSGPTPLAPPSNWTTAELPALLWRRCTASGVRMCLPCRDNTKPIGCSTARVRDGRRGGSAVRWPLGGPARPRIVLPRACYQGFHLHLCDAGAR